MGFQTTYEELKPAWEWMLAQILLSFQTTYEELKRGTNGLKSMKRSSCFQTTYEELKQLCLTSGCERDMTASRLPMRN